MRIEILKERNVMLKKNVESFFLSLVVLCVVFGCNTSDSQTGNTAQGNKVLGEWSKSSSSPWGVAPTDVVTNAGYYKSLYTFNGDGTYTYKAESWGGYSRSNEFWTIEESGTYKADDELLTIMPKVSKATLRNREGDVSKTLNNELEKVTYKWSLHYFEGINENQLVLQTDTETKRDGMFTPNELFRNSYLFSSKNNIEWRF